MKPFSKLTDLHSVNFGGTGLGLSISREIAKLLGGYLDLKSKVNEGSEFSLIIPMSEKLKRNEEIQNTNSDQNLVDVILGDVEEIKQIIDYKDSEISKAFNHLEIPEDVDDDRDSITKNDKVILIVEDDTNFAKALLKFARMQNYKGCSSKRRSCFICSYAISSRSNFIRCTASCKRWMGGNGRTEV